MRTRVGLMWPQTSSVWTAGGQYFDNLLTSLALAGHADDVVVLEPEGGAFASTHEGSSIRVASYPAARPDVGGARRLARAAARRLGAGDRGIADAVRGSGADVVFADPSSMARFPVPWVGWIADFQHREEPRYFDAAEIAQRDRAYRRLAEDAALVLLSSRDAEADFARFAPDLAQKARVAPFVSLFDESVLAADPRSVAARYGVEGPYVVVPNQWWRHKNHEVAIRAAGIARDRGSDVTWVFTGALSDYRDPGHASRALQLIASLGVRETTAVLGALPRSDQVQIMRGAEAVVQPSLFEGWSTVVEDAKSLGLRLVVSDIPVHREQEPPAALFFDPSSAEDLADKVSAVLAGAVARPDERDAMARARDRARTFGERFHEVCAEAASAGRP